MHFRNLSITDNKQKMRQLLKFITWPTIAGVLTAVIILDKAPQFNPPGDETTVTYSAPLSNSYAPAVEAASPSVVNIYTSKVVRESIHPLLNDPFLRRLFRQNGRSRERVQRSLGSGVIISNEGLILTNNHVISGADEILVLLHDGREALATLVGSDPDTDLAVLRIELKQLEAISLANSSDARVGDVVLAIGNPYGFGHSVSQGIVSATGRYGLGLSTYENFIQTDAAINQGNSGGALVDSRGRLLGINTAIYTNPGGGSMGIGLATPIDLALGIMEDLINYGQVIRGWLGLEVRPIISRDSTITNGLLVTATHLNGPGDKAGLRQGDIITHIDNKTVVDGRVTMHQIAMMRPGESISVTISRDTSNLSLKVELGTRPNQN